MSYVTMIETALLVLPPLVSTVSTIVLFWPR